MLYFAIMLLVIVIVMIVFVTIVLSELLQHNSEEVEDTEEGFFTVLVSKSRSIVAGGAAALQENRNGEKSFADIVSAFKKPVSKKEHRQKPSQKSSQKRKADVQNGAPTMVIKLDDQRFDIEPVEGSSCTIGMRSTNDLVIPNVEKNEFCSRLHATITFENGSFHVTNHSDNGTWINHKHLKKNETMKLDSQDCVYRICLSSDKESEGCLLRAVLV